MNEPADGYGHSFIATTSAQHTTNGTNPQVRVEMCNNTFGYHKDWGAEVFKWVKECYIMQCAGHCDQGH